MSLTASASIQVTFVMEYRAGSWGENCPIGQIYKQARDEAENVARRVIMAASKEEITLKIKEIHKPIAIITPDRI